MLHESPGPVGEKDGELDGLRLRLAEVEAREAQLTSLVAAMPDMIVGYDHDLRHVFCSRAVERQLGVVAEALLGRRPHEVDDLSVDDARSLEQLLQQVLATGQQVEVEQQLSLRSEVKHFHLRIVPECDTAAVPCLLAVFRDITDRQRAESEQAVLDAQLTQVRTMEAVGTLAGGVAHDVNNLLAGLQGSLSLLDLEEAVAPAHRFHLRSMEEVVRRGAELARQLLAFARRGACDAKELDLEAIMTQIAAVVGRSRPQVAIELDLAADLDPILADRTQLEQALLTLCLTVARSMTDGGTLRLRGANAVLTRQQTEPYGATPGRFVELAISDTGNGFDAATRARIFEPFFTTRVLGHGSGLGLASVWATVRNHGGLITVDSELGRGSVFTLDLPATAHPSGADALPSTRPAPGRGLILVVDDEPNILDLHARLLRVLGYDTLTANGGRRAVELLAEHRERIALVLLDLTMPETSGALTFAALRTVMPDVKVLLCSGFAAEGEVEALIARGCAGYIQKPFTVAALAERIQSVL